MKYTGGCHCGAVRYEVEMTLDKVISCNCSICQKKGYLLAFAGEEQFKLLSGESDLQEYQFGKKRIQHMYCSRCGVGSFCRGTAPDGKKMRAINVRCLDGVELETITPIQVNGRNF